MELNPTLHPVGTKYIGHRWQYRYRHDGHEDGPINRATSGDGQPAPWSDTFDPEAIPAILIQRYPGDSLISAEVMEYSPSGEFVRLSYQQSSDMPTATSAVAGFWTRTRRHEILEILHAP